VIAHLTGTVARVDANSVVVDVNGVGYRALVPVSVLDSLPPEGEKVSLFTTMIVREDDITLYGFRTSEEQSVFQSLIGVTGVGPKVALSLLSVLEGPALASAIASGDSRALTRVPGVGPKLAQRIVLELGDAMARFAFEQRVQSLTEARGPAGSQTFEDIVEALVNLQYSRTDARKAAEKVLAEAGDAADVPRLIRDALNVLSGGR
jgi:Holliday junction DNA helicase RuvA